MTDESRIEQELKKNGRCLFQTVGNSMEPLLHNRKSTVLIERADAPLRQYDVALYRRPNGQHVLHRVVALCGDHYLIRGDNRLGHERVPYDWVLGKMIGLYPDETECFLHCGEAWEQDYLRSLRRQYPLRWLRALPERVLRRLRRMLK